MVLCEGTQSAVKSALMAEIDLKCLCLWKLPVCLIIVLLLVFHHPAIKLRQAGVMHRKTCALYKVPFTVPCPRTGILWSSLQVKLKLLQPFVRQLMICPVTCFCVTYVCEAGLKGTHLDINLDGKGTFNILFASGFVHGSWESRFEVGCLQIDECAL